MSGESILNNRYKLTAQQGAGGMAVIYKATDMALGRTVAVKVLRPSVMEHHPELLVRFQNEARSIANLHHPNIVTVHDVGAHGEANYIVMEFVNGYDLKKIIRTHGTLPVERALNLAIGICAGLGFAHRSKIVHADVKPQNILITSDDVVKVTDFGIAQALSDTMPGERADVVWGSPHYFAPEQAQGERPTAASDVYSIGVVMFEMLTGRLPFIGTNHQELAMAHVKSPIPMANEINPNVPVELARIIYKTMSKKPTERYSRADQLGRVLIAYRDHMHAPNARGAAPSVDIDDLLNGDATPGTPQEQKVVPSAPASSLPDLTQPAGSRVPSSGERAGQGTPVPFNIQRPPGMPEALPTQRYAPVPNAPDPLDYQQHRQGANPGTPPAPPASYGVPSAFAGGSSQPMRAPHPYQMQADEDLRFSWDGVTIALAMLAFMSVACLIPLYIAVLNARL